MSGEMFSKRIFYPKIYLRGVMSIKAEVLRICMSLLNNSSRSERVFKQEKYTKSFVEPLPIQLRLFSLIDISIKKKYEKL